MTKIKNEFFKTMKLGFIVLLYILFCWSAASYSKTKISESHSRWVISDNLTIEKVTKNVWLHVSQRELDDGRVFPANGLLIRDGDELIMVDTAWGENLTTELIEWIKSEIDLPIHTAIVSHFHNDSMSGTSILQEHGVRVLGNPLTLTLAQKRYTALPEALSKLESGSTITLGNIEIFFPGAGHSRDNLFVWVPEAKLLFGGCSVRSPDFPGLGNTRDADIQNWPIAIKRVQQKYSNAKIVVPGHGAVADEALLSYTLELFTHNKTE